MIRKILLATDGSDEADKTDQFALDLAKATNAEVVVMCNYQPPSIFRRRGSAMMPEFRDAMLAEVKVILAEVTTKIQAQGLTVSALAIEGATAEAVLQAAEEVAPDLIVIGSGGGTGLPGMLLGGVADVVRHATVPVVVVK